MSQVPKFNTGGTAPKAEAQTYVVRVNGQDMTLGHEQAQSWFNDYVKAGGGKTKNRDEWNTNFNDFLGTIKSSNAKGQAFDFDLQGDTVGDIAYTGDKNDLTNQQLGLKDNGKAAKPGLFAGVSGVHNQGAIRGSLMQGFGDFAGKLYTKTNADNAKLKADNEAKAKADADKAKAEGMSNYQKSLSDFDNDLDPGSLFRDANQKNGSLEFALKSYHTADKAGQANLLNKWNTGMFSKFSNLHSQAQTDPEMLKLFQAKFGAGADKLLASKGANFAQLANPEVYGKFTDRKSYDDMVKATAGPPVPVKLTANADGTFTGADGRSFADEGGTQALNGKDAQGRTWVNGKLNEGDVNGLRFKGGLPYKGYDKDLDTWYDDDGSFLTGLASNGKSYDRTNYKQMPIVVNGKRVDFKKAYDMVAANGADFQALPEVAREKVSTLIKNVLTNSAISSEELAQFTKTDKLVDDKNYNPFKALGVNTMPEYFQDLTMNYSNFDRSKGAIVKTYNAGAKDENGIDKVEELYIAPTGRRHYIKRKETDGVGNVTLVLWDNEKKIPVGLDYGKPKVDPKSPKYYAFDKKKASGDKQSLDSNLKSSLSTSMKKSGGKFDKLKVLKFQQGGGFTSLNSDPTGGYKAASSTVGLNPGQEKHKVVSIGRMNEDDYQMTTTDKLQLGALIADIGGLGATIAGPAGNAVGAGLGLAATGMNFAADVEKDGFQWGDAGTAAVGGLMDLATLIPVAGTGFKGTKIVKALAKNAHWLGKALAVSGATQAGFALKKIVDEGASNATMDDWKALVGGLTGVVSGKRMGWDKAIATTKGGVKNFIKDAKGVSHEIDEAAMTAINNAKTSAQKIDLAKAHIAAKMSKPNAVVTPADVQLPKGFGVNRNVKDFFRTEKLKTSSEFGEESLDEITTGGGIGGWLKNRAIRRVALANPEMKGADKVVNQNFFTLAGTRFQTMPFRSMYKKPETEAILNSDQKLLARAASPSTNPTKEELEAVADPISEVTKTGGSAARITDPNRMLPEKGSPNWIKGTPDAPLSAEEKSIRTASSRLTNLFQGKANAKFNKTPVNTEIAYKPGFQGEYPTRNADYISEVARMQPKKQVSIKEALDAPKNVGSVEKVKASLNQKELKNLKKSLNISTNKTHEIPLERIINPTKGSKDDAISKKILGNKKLTAMVEKAMDEGKTSIKFKEGGIIKADTGVKLPWIKSLNANLKPVSPLMLPAITPSVPQWDPMKAIGVNTPAKTTPNVPFKINLRAGLTGASGVGIGSLNTGDPNMPSGFKGIDATKTVVDNGLNNIVASSPGINIKKDTLSELGRALFNRETARRVDTRVTVPMSTHMSEVSAPVKGDLLLSNAYDKSAARIMADAGVGRTSDSMINLAGRLSAAKQAEDIRMQGAGANAESIARSEARNLQLQQGYAQSRQQVANQNAHSLATKEQTERQYNNQKMIAMDKSVDNFWATQNSQNRMDALGNKAYDSQIAGLNMNSKFSKEYGDLMGQLELAQANVTRANAGTDPVAKKKADDEYLRIKTLGQQASTNQQLLRLQLMKNPNFNYQSIPSLINYNPNATNMATPNGTVFHNSRKVSMATGGKLTAETKIALEEYKQTQKAFSETAKDHNKWLSLKIKEDKKESANQAKSIDAMIKQALKG